MSEREKMIGNRLRAFRESLQIPRSRFSVSVGYASERLAAYEAGRARLPYGVFRAVARRYQLYPGWLAEGAGPPQAPNSFDDADFIDKIPRHALFTEVYDKYLAKQLKGRAGSAERGVEEEIGMLQELIEVLSDEAIPRASRVRMAQKVRGPVEELRRSLHKNARLREKAGRRLKKIIVEAGKRKRSAE